MSMKVLIADPDWRFSVQITRWLESHAHLVATENQRGSILGRIHHWQPDLVVVAAEMVDSELSEALVSMPDRPAVLLTGWMDRYALAWRVWQECGDDFLMKPVFHWEEVHQAVVTALENAASGERRAPATAASA